MNRAALLNAYLILALSTAVPASTARAGDWEFEIAPYLWVSGVDGDITVKGEDFKSSADFEDILDQTKFGGSAIFAANRGRWVNLLQVDYLALENDDIERRVTGGPRPREDIHLEMDSLLATATTGYRLPFGKGHSIDIMAGVRFMGMDATVDLRRAGELESDREVYDAVIMLRPLFVLSQNWTLLTSASIGTGDSDLTWELFPEVIYQPGRLKFRLGYRNLDYDFEKGSDEFDFSMQGLLLGVGFTF